MVNTELDYSICNCFFNSYIVWLNRFVKQPKKYALVYPERNPENKRKQMKEVLKPFDLTKCSISHLSEGMQSFMKAIVSVYP